MHAQRDQRKNKVEHADFGIPKKQYEDVVKYSYGSIFVKQVIYKKNKLFGLNGPLKIIIKADCAHSFGYSFFHFQIILPGFILYPRAIAHVL